MKLYIAEKPSLARAIADVLPKPQQKADGMITLANGDCISWCIGHLLEQAEPDHYDDAYKKWRLEHLPITPEAWQLQPKKNTKKQLSILVDFFIHFLILTYLSKRENVLLLDFNSFSENES